MRPHLDDASLVQHHNQVGVHHRLDAVGNHEGSAPLHEAFQGGADGGLGLGVHAGGGIVQDEDARVFQEGAGDGDALLLPARKGHAALPHQGIVTIGEGENHVVDGGSAGRGLDFGLRHCASRPVSDVFPQGAAEQEGFLLDDADLPAQPRPRIRLEFHAVQKDAPAGVIVKTGQQVDQGGLPGAGGTEQRHDLPGPAGESDVLQSRNGVILVGEGDVVEDEVAAGRPFGEVRPVFQGFGGHLEDIHQPPVGDQSRGGLHNHASQVTYRPDEPDHQPDVGQVSPDGHFAADGEESSVDEAAQHLHSQNDVRDRPEEAVHHQKFLAAQEFLPVLGFELAFLVIPAGEGFDDPHAAQVLLQGSGQARLLLLVGLVGFGDFLEEPHRNGQDEGDDDHRSPGQTGVQAVDGDEVDDEEEHDAPGSDGLVGEEAAHGVHIGGSALHQVAGGSMAVVSHAQALDVVEEVVAHPPGDAFGGIGGQFPGEEGESALEEGQEHEAQGDPGESLRQGIAQNGLRFPGHHIGKVAQEDVGRRFGGRRDCQRHRRADVGSPEAAHHAPQPHQAVFAEGLSEVNGVGGHGEG